MRTWDEFLAEKTNKLDEEKWIPHDLEKGKCTPMTKPGCTGHARALAHTFKKHHGFHHEDK